MCSLKLQLFQISLHEKFNLVYIKKNGGKKKGKQIFNRFVMFIGVGNLWLDFVLYTMHVLSNESKWNKHLSKLNCFYFFPFQQQIPWNCSFYTYIIIYYVGIVIRIYIL